MYGSLVPVQAEGVVPLLEGRSNYYIWRPLMEKQLILLSLLHHVLPINGEESKPGVEAVRSATFGEVARPSNQEIAQTTPIKARFVEHLSAEEAGVTRHEQGRYNSLVEDSGKAISTPGDLGRGVKGTPDEEEREIDEKPANKEDCEERTRDDEKFDEKIDKKIGLLTNPKLEERGATEKPVDDGDKATDEDGQDTKELQTTRSLPNLRKPLSPRHHCNQMSSEPLPRVIQENELDEFEVERSMIRVYMLIYSKICPKLQCLHVNMKTARELWQDLEEVHGYQSAMSNRLLQHELKTIRLRDYVSVDDFDSAFRAILAKMHLGNCMVSPLAIQVAFCDATKIAFPNIQSMLMRHRPENSRETPCIAFMMRVLRDLEMKKQLEVLEGHVRPDVNTSKWRRQGRKLRKERPETGVETTTSRKWCTIPNGWKRWSVS